MNTNKIKLAALILCGAMFTPLASYASGAIQLSETTVLFTIDFSFTSAPFAQQVPIMAKSGVTYQDRVDWLGYTIESSTADTPPLTEVNALVLSKNPVAGTRYDVPAETDAFFTLFILATFAEPVTDELRARITKLPYFIEGQRTTVHQNQLDEFSAPTFKPRE